MEIKFVHNILAYQKKNYPKSDAICSKENGKWVRYSIDDVIAIVNKLSISLLNRGIKKGDTIALYSNNRAEWNFVDFACQQIGAILVPLYVTSSEKDLKYILKHAECKIAFTSDQQLSDNVAKLKIPNLEVISFDKLESVTHWETLIDNVSIEDIVKLNAVLNQHDPKDCLTIIYTSGTTGDPKGVMLSHENLVFNMTVAIHGVLPEKMKGRSAALSFLPLCHIAERILNLLYVYYGISIYHAENVDTITQDLQEIKPQFFIAVPRLLEKVYEKIQVKGAELSGLKKILFIKSLDIAKKYQPGSKKTMLHMILDKLVFVKWREALGGEILAIGCGAAPLQAQLVSIFYAAGIPILEAYGLTETSPFISASIYEPTNIKLGSAGVLCKEVEVRIAEDGEILCRGKNVMLGYYKNDELTKEVIVDGWFHTGDVGKIHEGNFLEITDRKKEIFKTSGGKYIAPGYVENLFKSSRWIDHIMIVGVSQKFPAALIVPSLENLKAHCEKKNLSFSTDIEMIESKEILFLFEKEVEKINAKLGQWEKIKKFKIMQKAWSIDSGELTPTLKLKRRVINKDYEEIINSFYV